MLTARLLRKVMYLGTSLSPLVRKSHDAKTIYLSFDDGPHPIHSNSVMDILAQFDIKATFFLVGANIEKNMDTARRMLREGHLLGNHTYTHKVLTRIPMAERILEIDRCQKIIEGLQHPTIRIFRPPQGLVNLKDMIYLRRQKYKTLLWTIDSNDYHLVGDFESHLRRLTKINNVILFHDDNNACIEPLKKLLPLWIDQGYQFDVPKFN